MSEQCQDNCQRPCETPDTLPIHTQKITDSCRDKDCIEDLRVFLTQSSQSILDSAAEVRVRCAELLYAYIDVEPVAFDRNHYCVNVTFYYRILADAMVCSKRPAALCGLAVFHKRAVLCGEDSKAHIFRSDTRICGPDGLSHFCSAHPTAIVEALDPMVLSSKIRDVCECHCCETCPQLPEAIHGLFDEELVLSGDRKRMYVTLGQFSIIRLERDAQLVIPVVNYAIPTKPCCDSPGCTEDPCEMFSRIPFPAQQFTPKGCDDNRTCKPCNPPSDSGNGCTGCYKTT